MQTKYLFIDRDGTLINEPADQQVDCLAKLNFMPGVFTALRALQTANYRLVMVTNQDGLGTAAFTRQSFDVVQNFMLKVFSSQGIEFDDVLICPHFTADNCECRKPKLGLLLPYLLRQDIDQANSYVIGDRATDLLFAERLQCQGLQIGAATGLNWKAIVERIIHKPRLATRKRITAETEISIKVNLDQSDEVLVATGIGMFDHMLEQVLKYARMSAVIQAKGDLHIDAHHTIEDVAITFGQAIYSALGDKFGIERYAFVLPMDEAKAEISLDISGRAYTQFNAVFSTHTIGDLPTEMIPHFFQSFASGLQATLHVNLTGDNAHHVCEAGFKALGQVLRQAMRRTGLTIPSTKGVLC
jgi:imidazoleglycerol-phosphate dehydratase / histidinol-phosphatase